MLTAFFPDSRNAEAAQRRRPPETAVVNRAFDIGAAAISVLAQRAPSTCHSVPVRGTREGLHDGPFSGFDDRSQCERAHDSRIPRSLRVRRAFLRWLAISGIVAVASPATAAPATGFERGRYLVVTSHCNNCHTAGYAAAEGAVPEDKWLMGNPVGWKGRDGTVFAPNLRLMLRDMSEEQWLLVARQARARPPMPWWSVRDMNDEDLRMIYRYIKSLSPIGPAAPDFLPADQQPSPPYNQLPDMSVPRACCIP
jgi:mono/diheme cytochrome c family protein